MQKINTYVENTIKKIKSYSLSNFDLLNIDPNIRITMSFDIKHKKFIDELVNQQGVGIILWQYSKDLKQGHWLGVIRNIKHKTIEIFDPYAFNFKDINKKLNIGNNGLDYNILKNLIKNSGYKAVFSKKRLQDLKVDDNTCGRWVVLRLAFYKYTNKEFHEILNTIKTKLKIKPINLAIITTLDIH